MLKDSPGQEYREMYEKASKNDWIVDNSRMDQVRKDYLAGKESFQVKSPNYKWLNSAMIKKTGKPIFRQIKKPFMTAQSSIVVPKNGPVTSTFEKYISRSFDHGIFKKLRYHYQLREGNKLQHHAIYQSWHDMNFSDVLLDYSRQKSADVKPSPLQLKHFYLILIITGIFYLLSIFCFLYELQKVE